MNTMLLLLAVALTAMLILGLRTMQEDHLFSIGHRVELGVWAMFALYMGSVIFFGLQPDLMKAADVNGELPLMVKVILLGLMMARLLSCAAFTLGNPPKVRIQVNPKAKQHLNLRATTNTPGLQAEADGSGRVLL